MISECRVGQSPRWVARLCRGCREHSCLRGGTETMLARAARRAVRSIPAAPLARWMSHDVDVMEVHSHETRHFRPTKPHGILGLGEAKYNEMYEESISDPTAFWGRAALDYEWSKPVRRLAVRRILQIQPRSAAGSAGWRLGVLQAQRCDESHLALVPGRSLTRSASLTRTFGSRRSAGSKTARPTCLSTAWTGTWLQAWATAQR